MKLALANNHGSTWEIKITLSANNQLQLQRLWLFPDQYLIRRINFIDCQFKIIPEQGLDFCKPDTNQELKILHDEPILAADYRYDISKNVEQLIVQNTKQKFKKLDKTKVLA